MTIEKLAQTLEDIPDIETEIKVYLNDLNVTLDIFRIVYNPSKDWYEIATVRMKDEEK